MQISLPLVTIAVLGLAAATMAQDAAPAAKPSADPAEVAAPAATPAPAATGSVIRVVRPTKRVPFAERTPKPQVEPEERPRSFWERLFGRRRRPESAPVETAATPTSTPKATPKVARKVKPAATPPVDSDVVPATTPAPKSVRANATPAEKSTEDGEKVAVVGADSAAPPVAPKATPAPKTTPAPKGRGKIPATAAAPSATPARKAPVAPSADADADAQEKYKYDLARNKALEDPEVQKLKEKADGATTDDEARKAQRAYNKALFSKMRSIDGSIKDRADRIEASIMRRLDSAE